MLVEAMGALLSVHSSADAVREAERSGFRSGLWAALVEAGFTRISLPVAAGGSGGDLADERIALQVLGGFAAPVPVAEDGMLGAWALHHAGLEIPAGLLTVSTTVGRDRVEAVPAPGGWTLSGRLARVPFAAEAGAVVVPATGPDGEELLVAVRAGMGRREPGTNIAGEPRDTVVLDQVAVPSEHVALAPPGVSAQDLRRRGAVARAALISGALARVVELTADYTAERQQFGRPIVRFQAVAHLLVEVAEHARLAQVATGVAFANAESGPNVFDAATVKIVAGEAARGAARAAHQAHGAIGMTREYELGGLTRRLWSWRDEFGSDRQWSLELGQQIAGRPAEQLWPLIADGVRTP